MENIMIRIFSITFFIMCLAFIVCASIEIYLYFTEDTLWIPLPYFLFITPVPLLGYIMMRIGEFFDNKKQK